MKTIAALILVTTIANSIAADDYMFQPCYQVEECE